MMDTLCQFYCLEVLIYNQLDEVDQEKSLKCMQQNLKLLIKMRKETLTPRDLIRILNITLINSYIQRLFYIFSINHSSCPFIYIFIYFI